MLQEYDIVVKKIREESFLDYLVINNIDIKELNPLKLINGDYIIFRFFNLSRKKRKFFNSIYYNFL